MVPGETSDHQRIKCIFLCMCCLGQLDVRLRLGQRVDAHVETALVRAKEPLRGSDPFPVHKKGPFGWWGGGGVFYRLCESSIWLDATLHLFSWFPHQRHQQPSSWFWFACAQFDPQTSEIPAEEALCDLQDPLGGLAGVEADRLCETCSTCCA